ncbi:hypothetical protein BB560_003844, partial [Smittium megazygosporum]
AKKVSSGDDLPISKATSEMFKNYVHLTPLALRILDSYMIVCVASGIIQFVYCLIVGTYPYNAFLAGFGCSVASFCLTANLRIKANPINRGPESQSPNSAFADQTSIS